MTEMEVKRSADDRRRYEIDGNAWWLRRSWKSSNADAEVDGRRLSLSKSGLFRRVATAEDADTGEVVAEWRSRGGLVRTSAGDLRLRRAGRMKTKWALVDASDELRELVRFEPRAWKTREMRLVVTEDGRVPRATLVFAAWLVSALADDDSAAVTAGATAAVVAGS